MFQSFFLVGILQNKIIWYENKTFMSAGHNEAVVCVNSWRLCQHVRDPCKLKSDKMGER